MFQHRMQRRFHRGWQRGPWGSEHGRPGWYGPRRRFGPGAARPIDPELRSLIGDVRDLGRYLFRQGRSGAFHDTEKVRQLRDIVSHMRAEIETLFGPESSTTV